MPTKKEKPCCEKCYQVLKTEMTSTANDDVVTGEQAQCSDPFCTCHLKSGHLQSESIEWDKEKETGYPRYVLDIIEDCGHFEEMQKLLEISDGKLPSDEWNKIMDASVKKLVYAFHQAITTAVAKAEKRGYEKAERDYELPIN